MNPLSLLAQLRGGPQTPGALLSALAPFLTNGARVQLAALAELADGADLVGPRPAPPALAKLFREKAIRHGLPPGLLAAVAVVLSGVDPDFYDGGRVGLMGLPVSVIFRDTGDAKYLASYRCTYSALLDLRPAALEAVAIGVETAAAELARLRLELPGRMAGAIFRYCELGHAHRGRDEAFSRARVDAGHVAGAAILMGLRDLDRDFVTAAALAFAPED